MITCPLEYCGCPVKVYVPNLFEKALKEKEESASELVTPTQLQSSSQEEVRVKHWWEFWR